MLLPLPLQFIDAPQKVLVTLTYAVLHLAQPVSERLRFALGLGRLRHGDDRQDNDQDDQTEDDENGEAFHE